MTLKIIFLKVERDVDVLIDVANDVIIFFTNLFTIEPKYVEDIYGVEDQ